ncbi:hypothetical protein FNJ88_12095 [Chryseobacterium sp. SNU WT5]|uniref:DUF6705 family protein n=1 Tax=Chryseobacterium sp. SNU WT5 TaxID=2594269 RepID=UPI00117BFFED|nr:DUF6705 family protein [Chryseobacterium sp. SNU WT5]QDP86252.1 hypothetical protein FNJ88_12095 [Chryseobacterium sp. SNU WT5]
MKNTIKIIMTLLPILACTMCFSQKPGDNISDPYVDKFIGTWEWKNGNNNLVLILKKENILYPTGMTSDVILGFHQLIENGNVIEDNISFSNTNFNNRKWSILGNSDDNNSNLLVVGIIHKAKNKGIESEIQYIDSTHIKIISIKNSPGTKLKPYDKTISLPQNIILIKQ